MTQWIWPARRAVASPSTSSRRSAEESRLRCRSTPTPGARTSTRTSGCDAAMWSSWCHAICSVGQPISTSTQSEHSWEPGSSSRPVTPTAPADDTAKPRSGLRNGGQGVGLVRHQTVCRPPAPSTDACSGASLRWTHVVCQRMSANLARLDFELYICRVKVCGVDVLPHKLRRCSPHFWSPLVSGSTAMT